MRRGRSQAQAQPEPPEPPPQDGGAPHRYPRIVIAESEAEVSKCTSVLPNPSPPPVLQPYFPRPDDPLFPTAASKLLNLCAGGAAVLATGRGLMAAALATPGTGGRAAAFRRGFAMTFPIYLPAFLLGAAADHMLRREGRERGRAFEEYDLP